MNPQKPLILIIDDEKDLKDMVSEELARAGFHVITCSRLSEGRKLLLEKKVACVLTDMHLEDGDGTDIILGLRKDSRHPNHAVPIFVLSGYLNTQIVLRIRSRVSGVFVKPFDLSELVSKIRKSIQI